MLYNVGTCTWWHLRMKRKLLFEQNLLKISKYIKKQCLIVQNCSSTSIYRRLRWLHINFITYVDFNKLSLNHWILLEVDQLIFQSPKKHPTRCWQDYFARNSFTFEYLHNLSMAFLLYLGQKRNLVGNSGIHNLLYIFITHAFLINMLHQPCTYKKL